MVTLEIERYYDPSTEVETWIDDSRFVPELNDVSWVNADYPKDDYSLDEEDQVSLCVVNGFVSPTGDRTPRKIKVLLSEEEHWALIQTGRVVVPLWGNDYVLVLTDKSLIFSIDSNGATIVERFSDQKQERIHKIDSLYD